MPELPEVETVREGLQRHVLGRAVRDVEVRRDSVARRQPGGPAELAGRLRGRRLTAAARRGKFLWLVLDDDAEALLVHLGMSGQVLVRHETVEHPHPHLRARLHLEAHPPGTTSAADVPAVPGVPTVLDFVDQRTFGHLTVVDLVPTHDAAPGGRGSRLAAVPSPVAHIARDLLDPHLDRTALVRAVRARRSEVKRVLLDQTVVSGIGNIYADEALWRAGLHHRRAAAALSATQVARVLDAAAEVMQDAIRAGGTSFDALYVNVNGASGYFDRSLAVYGQTGRPCPRCGTAVLREPFMNRSSFSCPRCQPRPRRSPRPTRRAGPASPIP